MFEIKSSIHVRRVKVEIILNYRGELRSDLKSCFKKLIQMTCCCARGGGFAVVGARVRILPLFASSVFSKAFEFSSLAWCVFCSSSSSSLLWTQFDVMIEIGNEESEWKSQVIHLWLESDFLSATRDE